MTLKQFHVHVIEIPQESKEGVKAISEETMILKL
jgi:hypothetical protein